MGWLAKLLHPESNRRKAERKRSPGLVAYYWEGGAPAAHPVDSMSFTGLHLESNKRWHPGTLITMTIQRADATGAQLSSDDYIVILGRVIWSDGKGAGLEFIPIERHGKSPTNANSGPAGKRSIQKFLKSCTEKWK